MTSECEVADASPMTNSLRPASDMPEVVAPEAKVLPETGFTVRVPVVFATGLKPASRLDVVTVTSEDDEVTEVEALLPKVMDDDEFCFSIAVVPVDTTIGPEAANSFRSQPIVDEYPNLIPRAPDVPTELILIPPVPVFAMVAGPPQIDPCATPAVASNFKSMELLLAFVDVIEKLEALVEWW